MGVPNNLQHFFNVGEADRVAVGFLFAPSTGDGAKRPSFF